MRIVLVVIAFMAMGLVSSAASQWPSEAQRLTFCDGKDEVDLDLQSEMRRVSCVAL